MVDARRLIRSLRERAKAGRALCFWCGQDVKVTKKGVLGVHYVRRGTNVKCAGGRSKPNAVVVESEASHEE